MKQEAIEAAVALAALDVAPMGVSLVGEDGVVHWVNRTLAGIVGVPADDLTGRPEQELLSRHFMVAGDNHNLLQLLTGAERAERWFLNVFQALEKGLGARYFVDVTEMLKLRSECDRLSMQLENAVSSDVLTGLLNKRALLMALEPQVSRSRRYRNPLSVVVMVLRDYRAEGEQPDEQTVIKALGYFLRDQLRWVDSIGRTGEREFVLVLPETTLEDARKLIDKLRARFDAIPLPDDASRKLAVEVDFGVAAWQKGDDTSLLLRRAREGLVAEA